MKSNFSTSYHQLAVQHFKWVDSMNWHNKSNMECLCLISSEIGESLEALLKKDKDHFKEELSDIFLRTIDLAISTGVPNIDRFIADGAILASSQNWTIVSDLQGLGILQILLSKIINFSRTKLNFNESSFINMFENLRIQHFYEALSVFMFFVVQYCDFLKVDLFNQTYAKYLKNLKLVPSSNKRI